MHIPLQNLLLVINKVSQIIAQNKIKTHPEIIIVTKKFPTSKIIPLIEHGHIHFGENRIQEAEIKWVELKKKFNHLKLHMLGNLQSNKAKKAVQLFDYIHSLDSKKLALKISQYENELNKKTKIFISVNLGDEIQKSGISIKELESFYSYCSNDLSLNIIGLMCLPPLGSDPQKYFNTLKDSAHSLNLKELSMGMSSDFEKALLSNSTFLRLGTIIMGERPSSI